jgi:hypothetical protein
MVNINLHRHCRVNLNFIQKFPGYDFKNSNPLDPLDHYGQAYVFHLPPTPTAGQTLSRASPRVK